MANQKNIQIPEALFIDVYKLILALEELELPPEAQTLTKAIETKIKAKYAAMKRRELYGISKTAKTEAEREKARLKYVNAAGIPNDYRW